MSDKTHIDDYVKSRLNSRVHAFDSAHWEQAEALILSQERKKRRGFLLWLWFGLGSLPIILLGMGVLLYPYGKSLKETALVQQSPSQLTEKGVRDLPGMEDPNATHLQVLPLVRTENTSKQLTGQFSQALPNSKKTLSDSGQRKEQLPSKMALPMSLDNKMKGSLANIEGETIPRKKFHQQVLAAILGLEDRKIDIPTYLNYEGVGVENLLNSRGFVRHRIRFLAGGQLSPDFGSSALNFHPMAGGQYAYQLNPNLVLNLGLQYVGRAGLNVDSVFARRDFGFGFEEERTLRSPRRMHQMEIPLGMELRLKGRHYLVAGLYASLMLDVSGREATSIANEAGETLLGEERVGGLRQGFGRSDLGAYLGYKAYLGQGLFLGACVVAGSRDWTDNSFYQKNRFDRHLGLRLSLSQDLWRR